MARFHKLKVMDVVRETPEAVSIGLAVPEALKEDFHFVHGQYLTLKLQLKGEELRRSYSICSSPFEEGVIRIAVKKVDSGRASTLLVDSLKPGDELEVMTPMGNFHTQLEASHEKHYIAFAAGSGITPILSILMTTLRVEPRSRFTLFYGNSDVDRIIFRRKLDDLKAHHGDRLQVHHILSRGRDEDMLFNGRITTDKAVRLMQRFVTDPLHREFFICGPEQMMVNVSEALEKLGVDKKHIHIELFSSPVSVKEERRQVPPTDGKLKGASEVVVILDGRETRVEVSPKGPAILDAAIEAGLDVPFACKGAVCCTCKAKVMEGQVEMEMNYALTDQEVEEGFVLTCQSHPRSSRVVVDYDHI
ncbi:MAG: phenylacetate-CoA oxygenase/reductase subunit PaaK [Flavobacteriales bacterium]|nr:phenylacetate-CoA oxygenase/reductase subunit PaaK [Flavobacteriales bacterium]MCB9167918.1 phenylacetate-CoA oxygenase/reductase subunit PaaK [Flavobacteriales bacterium]